jgi:hypothetical protein
MHRFSGAGTVAGQSRGPVVALATRNRVVQAGRGARAILIPGGSDLAQWFPGLCATTLRRGHNVLFAKSLSLPGPQLSAPVRDGPRAESVVGIGLGPVLAGPELAARLSPRGSRQRLGPSRRLPFFPLPVGRPTPPLRTRPLPPDNPTDCRRIDANYLYKVTYDNSSLSGKAPDRTLQTRHQNASAVACRVCMVVVG